MFYRDQPTPPRRLPRVPTVETPHSEKPQAQMELKEPGQGTSVNNMQKVNSEDCETLQRTLVDEPMSEASLTSKRVGEPEDGGKKHTENKKKKGEVYMDEFNSTVDHLKVTVGEFESSNFSNIEEVLRIYPTLDVQRALGIIIATTGSTKPEESMPSHTKKF